jgi:hypothetical protein
MRVVGSLDQQNFFVASLTLCDCRNGEPHPRRIFREVAHQPATRWPGRGITETMLNGRF